MAIVTTLVVNKADAYCSEPVTLTSGMSGAEIAFEFSDEWEDLGKTAVFTSGSVTKYVILTSTNKCQIPAECLVTARQSIVVGVYGTDGDDIIIPTIYCALGLVEVGTAVTGSEPGAITQSLYNQVSALLTATETELTNVKETAIKSAEATVDANVGTPSVSVTFDWVDSTDHTKGKKATYAFHNLKGNGIASVVFDSDGSLVITRESGVSTTFNGIATAITAINSTNSAVASSENIRSQNESLRVSAELLRSQSESERVISESARNSAESLRATDETARSNAETSRSAAETSRSVYELSRDSAESLRATSESARNSAESSRSTAESLRAVAETTRVADETERESNETARVTAETTRRQKWGSVDATASQTSTVSATVSQDTSGTHFTFGIPKGESGEGLPSGGTTGQILQKASDDDYDTEWANKPEAQDIFFDCDIRGKLQVTDVQSAIDDLTDLVDELDDDKVDKTTTVNGEALSSNVTLDGSKINVDETATTKQTIKAAIEQESSQIVELTAAKHTHSNKSVLDSISVSDIEEWDNKQDHLTAGTNITIENNVISATGGGGSVDYFTVVDGKLNIVYEVS